MNLKERIKQLCKQQNISMNQLETELGFGKGYISKLEKSTPNAAKIQLIAKRLGVGTEYLLTGNEETNNNIVLSERDRRDIAKDLDNLMEKIQSGEDGPMRYDGEEIDNDTMVFLRQALGHALEDLKVKNKVKYNPNKNKSE